MSTELNKVDIAGLGLLCHLGKAVQDILLGGTFYGWHFGGVLQDGNVVLFKSAVLEEEAMNVFDIIQRASQVLAFTRDAANE